MPRTLCVDYGLRRTGVAVSDETRTIAQGLPTILHRGDEQLLAALLALIAGQDVDEIVIGLPLGRAGRPSARSNQVRAFARRLERACRLPVAFIDERGSSIDAAGILAEAGDRRNRTATDRIAATLLLEEWLESRRR